MDKDSLLPGMFFLLYFLALIATITSLRLTGDHH